MKQMILKAKYKANMTIDQIYQDIATETKKYPNFENRGLKIKVLTKDGVLTASVKVVLSEIAKK